MTDKEELDKSLGRLNQAGVVHVALTFLNGLIEDNEKGLTHLRRKSISYIR